MDENIAHSQAVIDQHTNLAEVPLHLEAIVKDEYETKSGLRPAEIDQYVGMQLRTSRYGRLVPFLRRYLDPQVFGSLAITTFGAMIGLPYHFRYLSTSEIDADWRNFASYLKSNGLCPSGAGELKTSELSDEAKAEFIVPNEQKRAIIQKELQQAEIMPYWLYDGASAAFWGGAGAGMVNTMTKRFKWTIDGTPYFYGATCVFCCVTVVFGYFLLKARFSELRELKALQKTVAKDEKYRKDLIDYYQTALNRNLLLKNLLNSDRITSDGELIPSLWKSEFWLPQSSLTIADRLKIVRNFTAKDSVQKQKF